MFLTASSRFISCSLILFSSFTGVYATTVFEDTFDYANEATLDAAYPIYQTAGGNPVTLNAGAMEISNAIVSHDLGATLTQDWAVSFNVIHTSDSRFTWFAMLNDAGTEGYVFSWNSLTDGSYSGRGSVQIHKQTAAAAAWDDTSVLTTLTNPAKGSGHDALGAGETPVMALFEASWDSVTDTITLSVDGVEKFSVTDSSYSSFSQFQIKGNASQLYDNIVITTTTIPEYSQAALGLGALALIACMCRRRSR